MKKMKDNLAYFSFKRSHRMQQKNMEKLRAYLTRHRKMNIVNCHEGWLLV